MTQVPAVTFWIQGRTGDGWQNLVHFADFEGAASSMRRLVRSGEYTQLRLVEATMVVDSDTPAYRERLRVKDGRIVGPSRKRAAAEAAPLDTTSPNQAAEPEADSDWLSIDLAAQARTKRSDAAAAPATLNAMLSRLSVDDKPARRPSKTQMEMQALLQAVAATKPTPVIAPTESDPTHEPAHVLLPDQAAGSLQPAQKEEPEFIRALRRVSQPPQTEDEENEDSGLRRPEGFANKPRLGTVLERSSVPRTPLLPEPEPEPALPPPHMFDPEPPRRSRRGLAFLALLALAILGGTVLAALDPRGAAQFVATLADIAQRPAGEPPLIAAILEDPTGQRVQSLLAEGHDPNIRSLSGTPALLVATRYHALDSLDHLMASGADPTAPEPSGLAILHTAAREGSSAAVAQMLAAGADIDMRSGADGCETPLTAAAGTGQLRTVQMLLERGATLDRPGECKTGLLDLAKGHPAVVARLESAFADKMAEGKRREKPAETAQPKPTVEPAAAMAELAADPARFPALLFVAIDGSQDDLVRSLLVRRPEYVRLDDVATFVSDKWGTGYRSAVDYALLHGERSIAATLMGAGLIPSIELFHLAIERRTEPELAGAAAFLIDNGVDLNAVHEGMTALMRAAHAGDLELAKAMLQQGANPLVQTENGLTAADFAPASADPALRELLAMQTKGSKYAKLMFGMSWLDRLDNVKGKLRDCRSLGDRFTACDVRFDPWLPDVEAVEAHFDRSADGRLVAIEVRSKPIRDRTRDLDGSAPRERFEQVRAAIEERLPKEHLGFATRQPPAGVPFWQGLKPDVKAGEYYAYWSDEEGSRPAFIYLKLTGRGETDGFYQIVIGNPFRIS